MEANCGSCMTGGEQIISPKDTQDSTPQKPTSNSRPSSVERKASTRDRDEKLRLIKERQNEERQRKIEELKAQAEAAQKYREQKEEERKRRIEELRSRDTDRRQQVEERKKAIMDAEKERREFLVRRNQERDAKLENKRRNEKGSHVYAFGSSTPRLLDPAELGTLSQSTYWGHRRSTSITNVAYTGAPLSRRSSERELSDGAKKRATSAGGIDRHDEDATDSPPISYRSVFRRKTDLMPTIPSPRESSFGSKTSLHSHTPRTPGSRSGDVTPGGSINTSRPGSAMSTSTTASVQRRTLGPSRKPRPASIAVTGVSLNDEVNKHKKEKPPLPKQSSTPKRVTSNSNLMSKSVQVENGKVAEKRAPVKKDAPTPKPRAATAQSQPQDNNTTDKSTTEATGVKAEEMKIVDIPQTKEEKEALNAVKTETTTITTTVTETVQVVDDLVSKNRESKDNDESKEQERLIQIQPMEITPTEEKLDNDTEKEKEKESSPKNGTEPRELSVERQDNEMTASMIARKITTEEQAKAVLAEKRRLMREEAERQAELERQRLEAERLAELKHQAEEEERQKKFEEETLRLAEEQKHAEEQRLLQAIEEAKKREEAERLKREEEERQRIEREETERKAKEEAEKQRLEVAERLKKEEKEREERRKRVEAIMSRTRAKGGNATPNSTPTKDGDNKTNGKDEMLASDNSKSSDTSLPEATQQSEIQPSAIAVAEHSQQLTATDAQQLQEQQPQQQPFSEQCAYEKTVTDKENALIKSFSTMIIDENAKIYPNFQNPFVQMTNGGKTLQEQNQSNESMIVQSMANGNGHLENINKNDTNQLVDLTATKTEQLIDFNNESQEITGSVNFNNNSLSTATTGPNLVTSDSHENKEISLL